MKTSSISQRVADFLRTYPPFEFMLETDLLALAGKGRVKFHESDEIVFSEGDEREPRFYVVQQGTVKLFKKNEKGEELVDVRVEGDLLGVFWIVQAPQYLHSARTASDTILYAFDTEQFREIAKRNSKVNRYLAAYFSMHPGHERQHVEEEAPLDHLPEIEGWLKMTGNTVSEEARTRLLTCGPEAKVCDVASRLEPGCQEACVVVDAQKRPLGILSEKELLKNVVVAKASVEAPVEQVMNSDFITVVPGLPMGDILLTMLRHRVPFICITQDGSRNTAVLGVLAERYLQLYHGRLPIPLSTEMILAETAEQLSRLRARADELLQYYLSNGIHIDWTIEFLTVVENTLVERALHIARKTVRGQGLTDPQVPFAWLVMHSEGRKERLLRSAQRTGLVYADPPEDKVIACHKWFMALANKTSEILETCGFPTSQRELMANNQEWCCPLAEWKTFYSNWIEHPVESDIITRTPFFDMRVAVGDTDLADSLRDHIHLELERHPNFMPLLANDALENLPPVTIFRDSVMDKSGVLWTSIDTKLHAMLPLVDVARVFALRYGLLSRTSTIERFEEIATIIPQEHLLFEEAAQAMRIALSLQSLTGLTRGDNGQYIRADELSKIDQENFKTVFRTIIKLMEFTAKHFSLK